MIHLRCKPIVSGFGFRRCACGGKNMPQWGNHWLERKLFIRRKKYNAEREYYRNRANDNDYLTWLGD